MKKLDHTISGIKQFTIIVDQRSKIKDHTLLPRLACVAGAARRSAHLLFELKREIRDQRSTVGTNVIFDHWIREQRSKFDHRLVFFHFFKYNI